MAKGQFKVMDSDIHVDEPHDLWLRYIEPRFKDRAPRFAPIDGSHSNGWQFEGKVFPAFFDRPERRRLGLIRREKARAQHLAAGRYKDPPRTCPATIPGPCSRPWTARASMSRSCFARAARIWSGSAGSSPISSAAVCRAFGDWLAVSAEPTARG